MNRGRRHDVLPNPAHLKAVPLVCLAAHGCMSVKPNMPAPFGFVAPGRWAFWRKFTVSAFVVKVQIPRVKPAARCGSHAPQGGDIPIMRRKRAFYPRGRLRPRLPELPLAHGFFAARNERNHVVTLRVILQCRFQKCHNARLVLQFRCGSLPLPRPPPSSLPLDGIFYAVGCGPIPRSALMCFMPTMSAARAVRPTATSSACAIARSSEASAAGIRTLTVSVFLSVCRMSTVAPFLKNLFGCDTMSSQRTRPTTPHA